MKPLDLVRIERRENAYAELQRTRGSGNLGSLTLRQLIRDKYAWPGGYPMYGITRDGSALCMDCMRREYRYIAYARKHGQSDGWRVIAVEINYEDTDCFCAHCDERIESAYGEDEQP